jgi:hypothetical protein
MGTDTQRAKLYTVVASHWGEEAAEVMMAVVPAWDRDEVARKVDVENCRIELKGEIAQLRGDFAALSGKVEAQFGRMIAVNAGMMFGFAGIVLAAAKLI